MRRTRSPPRCVPCWPSPAPGTRARTSVRQRGRRSRSAAGLPAAGRAPAARRVLAARLRRPRTARPLCRRRGRRADRGRRARGTAHPVRPDLRELPPDRRHRRAAGRRAAVARDGQADRDRALLRARCRIRPVRAADHRGGDRGRGWRISGHKVYSVGTTVADYGLVAARTSAEPSPYRGITLFLVPLDRPGITIGRLASLADEDFADVRLDGVEVPAERGDRPGRRRVAIDHRGAGAGTHRRRLRGEGPAVARRRTRRGTSRAEYGRLRTHTRRRRRARHPLRRPARHRPGGHGRRRRDEALVRRHRPRGRLVVRRAGRTGRPVARRAAGVGLPRGARPDPVGGDLGDDAGAGGLRRAAAARERRAARRRAARRVPGRGVRVRRAGPGRRVLARPGPARRVRVDRPGRPGRRWTSACAPRWSAARSWAAACTTAACSTPSPRSTSSPGPAANCPQWTAAGGQCSPTSGGPAGRSTTRTAADACLAVVDGAIALAPDLTFTPAGHGHGSMWTADGQAGGDPPRRRRGGRGARRRPGAPRRLAARDSPPVVSSTPASGPAPASSSAGP